MELNFSLLGSLEKYKRFSGNVYIFLAAKIKHLFPYLFG